MKKLIIILPLLIIYSCNSNPFSTEESSTEVLSGDTYSQNEIVKKYVKNRNQNFLDSENELIYELKKSKLSEYENEIIKGINQKIENELNSNRLEEENRSKEARFQRKHKLLNTGGKPLLSQDEMLYEINRSSQLYEEAGLHNYISEKEKLNSPKYELTDYEKKDIHNEYLRNLKIKKLFLDNLKVIKTFLSIKNNTDEKIEDAEIITRVIFKYNNSEFNYLKKHIIIHKKIWQPNDSKQIILNDFIAFSGTQIKKIQVHKPKEIIIEYFFNARNSVGYDNVDKEINKNELVKNNSSGNLFGKIEKYTLTNKDILGLGVKIHSADITNQWNDFKYKK